MSPNNNSRIEQFAITELKRKLLQVKNIDPYISEGDREPFFDGHIYVYKSNDIKNENYLDRIPIQIKGRTVSSVSKTKIKFGISDEQINAYLSSEGIMFFVVQFERNNDRKSKIYYSILLPFELKNIKKSNQKTFELKQFPDSPSREYEIFINYINNMREQLEYINLSDSEIERIIKEKNIVELTSTFTVIRDQNFLDPFQYMFNEDVYIYAKTKGGHKIPVAKTNDKTTEIKQQRVIKSEVSIGGKSYYKEVTFERSKDHNVLKIGNSFALFLKGNKKIETKINIVGNLSDRLNDLEFIKAAKEIKKINIGRNFFQIDDIDGVDIRQIENSINVLEKINKVLLFFKTSENKLDLDRLLQKDILSFLSLYDSIISNKSIALEAPRRDIFTCLCLANLRILSYIKPDNDDKYFIYNFFDKHYEFHIENKETHEKIRSSLILFLNPEELFSISNLDFEYIFDDIVSMQKHEGNFSFANLFCLKMIAVYDEKKQDAFLNYAEKILDWLLLQESKETDIYFLNKSQIQKRKNNLEIDVKNKLWEFLEKNCDIKIKICALILLENYERAETLYEKLSFEEKKNFDSFPIVNIWNSHKKITETTSS